MSSADRFSGVRVEALSKRYGEKLVVDAVDFLLRPGTTTLLRGANGSGKSTLLRMLAMLIRPTAGRYMFRLGERWLSSESQRHRIGYLGHECGLYTTLSGRQNLEHFAALRDSPIPSDWTKSLGLEDFWDRPVRTYSRGQRQRVGLTRALIASPQLLLLDEPFTGLDQQSVDRVIELLALLRERQVATLLVSHRPLEEWPVDRQLVIDQGELKEVS